MKIYFEKNNLMLGDRKIIFLHPIQKILEMKSGVVILLEAITKVSDRNVYFVNFDGSVKWRINDPSAEGVIDFQYYMSIGLDSGGTLEVNYLNRSSVCKVRIDDGTIYNCEFSR